jgi:hypothetical protein
VNKLLAVKLAFSLPLNVSFPEFHMQLSKCEPSTFQGRIEYSRNFVKFYKGTARIWTWRIFFCDGRITGEIKIRARFEIMLISQVELG